MARRPVTDRDVTAVADLWNQQLKHEPISETTFHSEVLDDPNFEEEGHLASERDGVINGFVSTIVPCPRAKMAWTLEFVTHAAMAAPPAKRRAALLSRTDPATIRHRRPVAVDRRNHRRPGARTLQGLRGPFPESAWIPPERPVSGAGVGR